MLFIALFARVLGFLCTLPFGWETVGVSQRFTLALCFAVGLSASLPAAGVVEFTSIPVEFLLGVILAIPAALVVEIAAMSGELFDIGRGQSQASTLDPLQHEVAPVSSAIARYIVWALMLGSGFLSQAIVLVGQSIEVAPLGALNISVFSKSAPHLLNFIPAFLANGMTFILPFLLLFLLIEIFLGLLSKCGNGLSCSNDFGPILKVVGGLLLLLPLLSLDWIPDLNAQALPILSLLGV